jgi:hypothetical protein
VCKRLPASHLQLWKHPSGMQCADVLWLTDRLRVQHHSNNLNNHKDDNFNINNIY